MRREFDLYDRDQPEPAFGGGPYRLYELVRRVQYWLLRPALARLPLGSRSWHLAQHYVSGRSALDVDWRFRSWFYETSLPGHCSDLYVLPGVTVSYPRNLRLGQRVTINRNAFITCPAPVSIGDCVLIGANVVINSGNHRYGDPGTAIRDQGHDLAAIVIEDDVWIAANVTITAGSRIGRGAVIAAGSTVSGVVPPGVLVAGVPARPFTKRG